MAKYEHACDVLADRQLFELGDLEWAEFRELLDRPLSHNPRLEKLFTERFVDPI